jgi:hypothetical protein
MDSGPHLANPPFHIGMTRAPVMWARALRDPGSIQAACPVLRAINTRSDRTTPRARAQRRIAISEIVSSVVSAQRRL